MASILSLTSLPGLSAPLIASLLVVGVFAVLLFILAHSERKIENPTLSSIQTYTKFAYNCFIKPHKKGETGTQQDALESFYKTQASVYDATRSRLLQGREDMLGLVAAQIRQRVDTGTVPARPVWVDVRRQARSNDGLLIFHRLVVELDTTLKL
jgi:betaine lipid synthase